MDKDNQLSSEMESDEGKGKDKGNQDGNLDGNGYVKVLEGNQYKKFIMLKVRKSYPNITERQLSKALSIVNVAPGYTVVETNEDQHAQICLLCDQLARRPMKCCDCTFHYCRSCSRFLHVLSQAYLNQPVNHNINQEKLSNKQFLCQFLTCGNDGLSKLEPLDAIEKQMILKNKVNCINSTCKENGNYPDVDRHVESCKPSGSFKFDVQNVADSFLIDDEKINEDPSDAYFINQIVQKEYTDEDLQRAFKTQADQSANKLYYEIDSDAIQSDSSSSSKRSSESESNVPTKKKLTPTEYLQRKSKTKISPQIHLEKLSIQPSSSPTASTSTSTSTIDAPLPSDLLIKPTSFELLLEKLGSPLDPRPTAEQIIERNSAQQKNKQIAQILSTETTKENEIEIPFEIIEASKSLKSQANQRRRANKAARKRGDFDSVILPPKFSIQKPTEGCDWNDPPPGISSTINSDPRPTTIIEEIPPSPTISSSQTSSSSAIPNSSSQSLPSSQKSTDDEYKFGEASYYKPITQIPPVHTEESQSQLHGKTRSRFLYRRKNSQKYNQQKNQKRHLQYLKIIKNKTLPSLSLMVPPIKFAKTISAAVFKSSEYGINICSIDIEKQTITMKNGQFKNVPIWIAIVDQFNKVVYNSFIRHPSSSNWDIQTAFHGLVYDDVKYAPNFLKVREEVLTILRRYDRIILSGHIADLSDLFLSPQDHYYLLPRIVDVSLYYNCRINSRAALGIKYSVFILFGKIFQDKFHSPIVDAAFTLWLYLIDMVRIEQTLLKLYQTKARFTKSGHRGYNWPLNHNMGGLIKDVMKQINDWPDALKINPKTSRRTQDQDKIKQKFYSEDFIDGEPNHKRPFPYKHEQSLFSAYERR